MKYLCSGSFDDPRQRAFNAFKWIEAKGEPGWSTLIGYIDHEDLSVGRAAVEVLVRLTKCGSPLPREDTRSRLKQDWLRWYCARR